MQSANPGSEESARHGSCPRPSAHRKAEACTPICDTKTASAPKPNDQVQDTAKSRHVSQVVSSLGEERGIRVTRWFTMPPPALEHGPGIGTLTHAVCPKNHVNKAHRCLRGLKCGWAEDDRSCPPPKTTTTRQAVLEVVRCPMSSRQGQRQEVKALISRPG
ncbi:hypothetical protein J1605_003526 [Eschrichtius robustus]|uniref:Uncharacterized protein n=1 Tax=Eschrichtius robustus TaxID=9764 RepID=A0AB34HS99_ESCRO|nr:hypothetical protein J1605_003526 [Eschrichtius robustus]